MATEIQHADGRVELSDDARIARSPLFNRDLALSAVNWAVGEDKQISIRPRSVRASRVQLQADEVTRLMSEVESLSDNHREALMLFYYGDMSYRDMAQLLGVSTATINARLSEARDLLRERLTGSRRETHEL